MPPKARLFLRAALALACLAFTWSIVTRGRGGRGKGYTPQLSSPQLSAPQLSSKKVSEGVGVSLGLFASDPLWDYEVFLQELSALGVERLMIVVPLKLAHHKSSAPYLGVPLSTIERTARQARALNLSLTLMPVIQLKRRSMEVWRGLLAPQDIDLWWRNYRSDLLRLASLAEREGFERLVVGSELCSLEAEAARWVSLISSLRARFKGRLTYSANWDHYEGVPFWSLLDEVSMTAYFPLTSAATLEGEWRAHLMEMERFARAVAGGEGRPLIISEYGYPALKSALSKPWDETTGAPFDPTLQGELVSRATALLKRQINTNGRHAQGEPNAQANAQANAQPNIQREGLRGAFLWNWFGFGGTQDQGFTLRGRVGQAWLKAALQR